MGWMLMACSGAAEPEQAVAQTSQADTSWCMRNADCAPGYFCDGGQINLDPNPTTGGQCAPYGGPILWCADPACNKSAEVDMSDGESGGIGEGGGIGESDEICVSCTCTSAVRTFEGGACGTSTEEIIADCLSQC
jgi:hypothetical protein